MKAVASGESAWFHAGRAVGRDRDHRHFGGACCCRRFRRREKRHGGRNVKISSSKLAWPFKTTPARTACFLPAEQALTRTSRITWSGGKPFGPDKQGLGWGYQILPYLEEGALQGLTTQVQLQAAVVPLYVCPSRRSVGGRNSRRRTSFFDRLRRCATVHRRLPGRPGLPHPRSVQSTGRGAPYRGRLQ